MRAAYVKNGAVCVAGGAVVVGTDSAEPPCVCGGPPPPPPPVVSACCPLTGGFLPQITGGSGNSTSWAPTGLTLTYLLRDFRRSELPGGGVETQTTEYTIAGPQQFQWSPGVCPTASFNAQWTYSDVVSNGFSDIRSGQGRVVVFAQGGVTRIESSSPPAFLSNAYTFRVTWRAPSIGSSEVFLGLPPGPGFTQTLTPLQSVSEFRLDYFTSSQAGPVYNERLQQWRISLGPLSPCVAPGSPLVTGCSNCPDNLTGSAVI